MNEKHLEAIRRDGPCLEINGKKRRITYLNACPPEQATDAPDLLLVFTKTHHPRAALTSAHRLLSPGTHVLTLQNGLGNVETIRESVALKRILVGVTSWPGDLIGPGRLHSHGEGEVRISTADRIVRPFLHRVVETFAGAGLRCSAERSIWPAIWEKVAFNSALNSLCRISLSTTGTNSGSGLVEG